MRLPSLFFPALIVCGLGLIAYAYVEQSRASEVGAASDDDGEVLPDPTWYAHAPRKEHALRQLGELGESETNRLKMSLLFASAGASKTETLRSARAVLSMRRILSYGSEFDTRVTIEFEGQDEGAELSMGVEREGLPTIRWELAFQGDALAGAALVSGDQRTDVGGSLLGQDGEEGMPVGIGDFLLEDFESLLAALAERRVTIAGQCRGEGVRPLAVVEVTLSEEVDQEPNPFRAEGASALLHWDAQEDALRAVRVFDAAGFLVRAYDGFEYDAEDEDAWWPTRLNAWDVTQGSRTFVRVEEVSIATE
ncbi:MAG: hypothetical protein AAF682_22990 [Planctomycetota bacterium]